MATTQLRRMTASELWAMSNDGCSYLLIEGALHRISSASPKHGTFAARVDRHLDAFVDERELGEALHIRCHLPLTASAIAAMCSGRVPQHPPMMDIPSLA